MQKSRLTVYYNGTLWIGVYERVSDGRLEACKIIFGAEPKDYEVYETLLQNWNKLKFSPPVAAGEKNEIKVNPKRRQRDIRKQLETQGTGTKAQQALKLQQEQGKQARNVVSREQREAEKERQFELHREKRKQKHRGH